MPPLRVFIAGMGAVTPAGAGIPALLRALRKGENAFKPLIEFACPEARRALVGSVRETFPENGLPRTHQLALSATREAMTGFPGAPDAIVIGGTTGGIPLTEETLLRGGPSEFLPYHGTGTVAEAVARAVNCQGPVYTVSTACSSGAAALILAMELLRQGKARHVLTGGVDALCRLTFHGFSMLQVVDPQGCRPLDRDRQGMTVAEGAGFLLLEAADTPFPGAEIEVLGGGLSCDAYHATSPKPDGSGAAQAIVLALRDGGITPQDVEYINLHGTGTRDNDRAEVLALRQVFGVQIPPASSTKGLFGHSLAGSGALEAIVVALSLQHEFLPSNAGFAHPDPELAFTPVVEAQSKPIRAALSNSFGFGGNNAALVLGKAGTARQRLYPKGVGVWGVAASAVATGAGFTEATLEALAKGQSCAGQLSQEDLARHLPPRRLRRLKRLPILVLALADQAVRLANLPEHLHGVYLGTAWGPQSETCDFLTELFASGCALSSPTDFSYSVHNAPAGQVAISYGAVGPNITATGEATSFEQALAMAGLLTSPGEGPVLVLGADEGHIGFTPRFDRSVIPGALSDGGGAFVLTSRPEAGMVTLRVSFTCLATNGKTDARAVVQSLGGKERINEAFGGILAGIPAAEEPLARVQLDALIEETGFNGAVIPYRKVLGEYETASATAAALGARWVANDSVIAPALLNAPLDLKGRGLLSLTLGQRLSALEIRGGHS